MAHPTTQEFVAFVGIDWADTTHVVCLHTSFDCGVPGVEVWRPFTGK